MKIQAAVIALSIISQSLWGQLQTGDIFLGGSVSFQHSGKVSSLTLVNGLPSTQFSVSPSIGYALSPRAAIGGRLGYSFQKSSFLYSSSDTIMPFAIGKTYSNTISADFFVRYYTEVMKKAGFIIQSGIGGSYWKTRNKFGDVLYTSSTYSVNLQVSPMVYYFVNDRFCLEAGFGGLGVYYTGQVNDANQGTVKIDFSLHNSLSFAFIYFLGKGSSD